MPDQSINEVGTVDGLADVEVSVNNSPAPSSVPTITQIGRPYFTSGELKYLHGKTIKVSQRPHYERITHQVFQFCFQIIKQMKFPLRVLSTTMNYYQRWYLFNEFDINRQNQDEMEDELTFGSFEIDPFIIATACLFLACKNEDCIKKLKDIQTVANKIREIDDSKFTNERTTASLVAAASNGNGNNSSNSGSGNGITSSGNNGVANLNQYYTIQELQRKVILALEFKLLQIIKFDFNNGGSTNVKLTIDQLLIQFCKKLNINYKFSLFCWLIHYDIISTPLILTVSPHCIALAIIIVTLNLKPNDLKVTHFKDVEDNDSDINKTLDTIDSVGGFSCPEILVNEAIIYILDFYIHKYSHSILNNYLPPIDVKTGKDQTFKFMELKSKFNDLKILSEKSSSTADLLQQDNYLNPWDYTIAGKGSTRFMTANKRRKFATELQKEST
ncbi:cyclin-like protein [Scheffersomyces amazonensis]|uniref:cyclin-like protein n=1 Tax=Scheffersomyces amazonensis TaxID=1078765 RepID=UPI00315D6D19